MKVLQSVKAWGVCAATGALLLAGGNFANAAPVDGGANGAIDAVVKTAPLQNAETLQSSRVIDKNQSVVFGEDGAMKIQSARSGTLTVAPVVAGNHVKQKKQRQGIEAVETKADAGVSFVFAKKSETPGAGFGVINSRSSKHAFSFDIKVDGKPASLSVGSTGGVLVSNSNGTPVNYIEAPWAKDANGKALATAYTVSGNRLTQTVSPTPDAVYPVVADPEFGWMGIFPVVKFNKAETRTSTVAAGVLKVCARIAAGLPVGAPACALSAVQIAVQAVIANKNNECIQLAPAPIGAMAFRYTGGYCR